jgi:hypothetical protein
MEQLAVVARLKSGAETEAAELLAGGPPFDPAESGLDRHTVYLSADEVIFVFEGAEVEWIVDKLVDDPFHWLVSQALERWRPLLEDQPRIARPAYAWVRENAAADVASFHG